MRSWVDRVAFSSSALDTILNLLIVAGGILLLIVGTFLFAS